MDAKIHDALCAYGLSENESAVYLTLLKLNAAPASTIARQTGIKRVSVYPILQSLNKKGVIQEHFSPGGKYFSPMHPDTLLQNQEDKTEKLLDAMPFLVSLMGNIGHKPDMHYFHGVEGLKRMYNDLLSSQEPIHAFLGSVSLNDTMRNFLNDDFLPRRIQQKLAAKVILSSASHMANDYQVHPEQVSGNTQSFTQIIVVPDQEYRLSNEINLYGGNKVALALFNEGELAGMIIESKSLHDSLQAIFHLIWSSNQG